MKWISRAFLGLALVTVSGAAVRCAAAARDERWLRLSHPDFTIVTSLKEKEAQAWAGEFAQYVAALRDYFNVGQRKLAPLTIVVFARTRDFEPYRPLDAKDKPQEMAGYFSRQESWAVAGLGSADVPEDTRRTIFHEGVHWFMSGSERANPVWLEEGLAEVFSTFRVADKQAEWGRAIESHVSMLSLSRPEPLERVLSTGREDLFGNDEVRTSIVYAKSWAFVHFLLFGKHEIPRGSFAGYSDLMHAGTTPDEAFRKAFGRSYVEMDRLLQDYLNGGKYFVSRRALAAVAELKTETAAPPEVQDALGRLAFGGRRFALAATHARAVIAAAPDAPRGHELLGMVLKQLGDEAGAQAEFALAVEHGSRDFRPYFELAVAAQGSSTEISAGAPILSPADARQIANRYERAINLHPRFRLSYENLAGVIGLAEPWSENDRQFLEFGARLFPQSAQIKVGLAILLRRAGDKPGARAQLDAVLASESDGSGNARAYARRVDASWEQEDIFGKLSELADAQKFRAALELVDQHLERGVAGPVRAQLLPMRRQLATNVMAQEVQDALESRRWSEARRLLERLISSDAPGHVKTQARRSLADLDRQRLGLEETKN